MDVIVQFAYISTQLNRIESIEWLALDLNWNTKKTTTTSTTIDRMMSSSQSVLHSIWFGYAWLALAWSVGLGEHYLDHLQHVAHTHTLDVVRRTHTPVILVSHAKLNFQIWKTKLPINAYIFWYIIISQISNRKKKKKRFSSDAMHRRRSPERLDRIGYIQK